MGKPSKRRKASRQSLMELCAMGHFDGLETEQACDLLYRGIGSDDSLLLLNREVDPGLVTATRLYNDISYFLSIIRSRQPVRLTKMGNLNRALARELYDAGLYEEGRANAILRTGPVQSELDAQYLHYINILTRLAGFTEIVRRKLKVTERGEAFLSGDRPPDDYACLFLTHAGGLNWAYLDNLPEPLFIQEGFLFSLFIISRYGDEFRSADFYFKKYRRAFPYVAMAVDAPMSAAHPEVVSITYYFRVFADFLLRFGLVEIEIGDPRFPEEISVRKAPLFDEFIGFSEELNSPHPLADRAGGAPGMALEGEGASDTERDQRAAKGPADRDDFAGVYQFKITLKHVKPAVWRRIQVPSNYSFWDLHVAITDAMGWTDTHLHMFRMRHPAGRKRVFIATEDEDFAPSVPTFPEAEERIDRWFSYGNHTATYEYDFGDGWEHTVRFERMLSRDEDAVYPRLVKGKRACPPEDVGGPPGYERFLKILRNPSHPEHKMMLEWSGGGFDPEYFDPDDVDFDDPDERWESPGGKYL